MHLATLANHTKITNELIKSNRVYLSLMNKMGDNPFILAVKTNKVRLLNFLIGLMDDCNKQDPCGNTSALDVYAKQTIKLFFHLLPPDAARLQFSIEEINVFLTVDNKFVEG